MATRTIGRARFDHGAQHFSARSEAFRLATREWVDAGVAAVWFESLSVTNPGRGVEPRHLGVNGMRGVPEHLAGGLEVRTGVRVDRVFCEEDGVVAATSGHGEVRAQAAIVTAPVPQLLGLVDLSSSPGLESRLARIEYDRCLAVMAELDAPSGLENGHRALNGNPIAWLADNQHKGVSPIPALTIHSSPGFALAHIDGEVEHWTSLLVDAAAGEVEASIISAVGHAWRFAQPRSTLDSGFALVEGTAPIVLAGEVFAGARVEGAFTSGTAAALALAERLNS
jgi:predicted NAD/FAD-dependent oxidoreductase